MSEHKLFVGINPAPIFDNALEIKSSGKFLYNLKLRDKAVYKNWCGVSLHL